MGFGDSVIALLETYANCLKLLKAFSPPRGDHDSASSETLLRRSLKEDRAKVERAYSSRRSVKGSRFDKGDKPGRSAIRRVVKRLTASLVNLMHTSRNQTPTVDYESLMSLSNASRIDAIKAIDQLSHRLRNTSSRTSIASSSTSHRRRQSSNSTGSSTAATKRNSRDSVGSAQPKKQLEDDQKMEARNKTKSRDSLKRSGSRGSGRRSHSRGWSGSSRTAVDKRVSLYSFASDSTPLGEIPERKWIRRYDDETSSGEYNVPVTYPIRPYGQRQPEARESRGFWRMFRR